MKKNNGITLIALVITIIVLLILVAVSIATLTGENGLLTQAGKASEQTEIAEVTEKARLDIASWKADKVSKGEDSTLNDSVIKQILTGKDYVEGTPGEKSFISTSGHEILYSDLYESGETIGGTVEEAKNAGTVFTKNTTLQDTYGNTVKVPEGFKIASDSATDVTGGVVIEDVNHGATAGSQFVWIPVGTVYTNAEHTDPETIELSRYTFDDPENPQAVGADAISFFGSNFEEKSGTTENTPAINIGEFTTTAENSHGYYIGRYEARTTGERTAPTEDSGLTQITVEPNDYVYNYVTQPQTAKLSQEMYTGKSFTSDLTNSYAWDTAIVFIQKFEDSDYSNQTLQQSKGQIISKYNIKIKYVIYGIWQAIVQSGQQKLVATKPFRVPSEEALVDSMFFLLVLASALGWKFLNLIMFLDHFYICKHECCENISNKQGVTNVASF